MGWVTLAIVAVALVTKISADTVDETKKTESLHAGLDEVAAGNKTEKGTSDKKPSTTKNSTPLELGDFIPNKEKFSAYLIEAGGLSTNAEPPAKPPNATNTVILDGKRPLPAAESFLDYLQTLAFGAEGISSGQGSAENLNNPDPGYATWAPICQGKSADPSLSEPKNEASAAEKCIDKHPLCPFWETRGWCKKGPGYMRDHCSGACDTSCTKKYLRFNAVNECKDQRTECRAWQLAGQCGLKPFFMIWQCPVACKFCAAASESFVYEYTTTAFTCRAA